MYVIGHLIKAIAVVLDIIIYGFMWIVIARAILSWVSPDPYNPIVRFIHNVTEPILYPIRRRIPLYAGGFDFSPIIVILVAYFLQIFVVNSLMDLSASFLHR
ncbi:MAG: YggT family protein [Deltaproteobacteria bacterium]|nr:YggT family protein [Deltaproteobacteria bacterium]MBW1848574.1 YggT family protein [Deltaproteobacteria bacterium]